MDDLHAATVRAIDSRRRELSEAAVGRQYALHPDVQDRYGESGRDQCVEDTGYHLAHLSAAILASSSSLFADYVGWVGAVLAAVFIRPEDVRENFECLRQVLGEQLPEGMVGVVFEYLDLAMERLSASPSGEPGGFLQGQGDLSAVAGEYLGLLLACDRQAASRLVLGAVDSGISIRDVYLRVIQPCQRELGRQWQARRITVAQEHYCTAATQLIMSQLAPRLFGTERSGRRVVVACVACEAHEVGPRMVADLLELDGWDAIYLGGNVPLRDVVQSLVDHRADLLATSATMAYHLPAMIDLIASVRANPACAGVGIMAGGRPFEVEPALWRRVGADGSATDADEACRLADRLMSERGRGPASIERRGSEPIRVVDPSALGSSRGADDLYDELGLVNSEVVSLHRELARKNAEVGRLHAEVRRQAGLLIQADERKNEFLAMLGHELRNPLAPIRDALAILGRDEADRETVRWATDLMGRQVEQLVRLVDDLLDLARIMQDKLDLRKERVQLATVVANSVEIARPLIDARGHTLTTSLPDEPVVLDADPIRLAQVFSNLLTNAVKYSDPGGEIVLSTRREGDEVLLSVQDQGVGIAPEMLPTIFDLFMQENRTLDRSQGGLGVGLALVKSLVAMHGGSIVARSEGLGRGSEFLVRLPISSATLAQVSEEDRTPVAAGVRGIRRRILVVDDHLDAANALARLLMRLHGQDVRVAHNGPQALAVAEEFSPDFVLLDIGLPGMDGYEVARRLRGQPKFQRTRIVALSGWGQESDVRRSSEAGFDDHLVKPATPEAILKLLVEPRPSGADAIS